MMDSVVKIWDYWSLALGSIDNIVMTVALAITATIFAAVGGLVSARMRLYGAVIGGMMMKSVVKANGGGYGAALAAMALVTGLAFAVGSTPFLLRVMKNARRGRP